MAESERPLTIEHLIVGRLVGVTNKTELTSVPVWFAYQPVDGADVTVRTTTDRDGAFAFDVPEAALERAVIGAEIEGVQPVDLEPKGRRLEAGDLVLLVDDIVPAHLRYAG